MYEYVENWQYMVEPVWSNITTTRCMMIPIYILMRMIASDKSKKSPLIAEAPHHPWQWVVHSAAPSSAWAPLGQHPAAQAGRINLDVSAVKSRFIVIFPICQIYSFFFQAVLVRKFSLHDVAIITVFVSANFEQRQPQVLNKTPNLTNQTPAGTEMWTAEAQEKTLLKLSFHCTNRFRGHLLTSAHWGLGSDWKPCRALMNGMICKRKAAKWRKWGKYQKCISQAWRSKQRRTLHVVWVNGGFCSSVVLQTGQEDHLAFAKQDEEPKWLHCPGRRHSTAQSGFNEFNATLAPDSINSINSITASNSRPSTSLSRLWRSLHMAPNFSFTTDIRFQTQFQTRNCDLKLPRPQPVKVGEPSLSSCPTSQQQRIHQKSSGKPDSPWACSLSIVNELRSQSAFYRGIAEITLCQSISEK